MTTNIPISVIDGIVWPAAVVGEHAMTLALQFQLEQSQWWTEDELVSKQLEQLGLLLQHAVKTVPYYRKSYAKLPFDFAGRLTLAEWRRLPILTRSDLQKAGESLYSKAIPARHGKLKTLSSSGSTGKPVKVKQTTLCGLFSHALTLRGSFWHRRDLRGKMAVIRHMSQPGAATTRGLRSRSWGGMYEGAFITGPSVYMHSNMAISVQADWLLREKPAYLLAYPSVLHGLARHFIEQGLELPGLLQVRAFGEVLDEETRLACRQAWNVAIVDSYSCQEVGSMALQCPEHEHYHVHSESALVEILDDEGNSCRAGETGRVIVTPMHNFATPLLRYEVGDFAEVGAACDCGRGLPVIKRILGRTRNLVTLPDGSMRRPSVGIRDFEKIASVSQAQLVQRSLEHVEVRLVTDAELSPGQEKDLAILVQEQVGYPFRVTFTYMNEIPRGPTGKYEDFMSEV